MSEAEMPVSMQFDDAAQEHEAVTLGMWTFLATEVLFFGAVLMAFTIYRWKYGQAFAEAGERLYPWIGTANTGVLLLSSFTMALAVHEIEGPARRKHLVRYLLLTAVLGSTFIGVKAIEYFIDYREGLMPYVNFHPHEAFSYPAQSQLFFFFYFFLTILHATHMSIGIVLMLVYAIRARRDDFAHDLRLKIEMFGLYWHFVDVVWIFLFPILYLIA